MRVKYFVIQAFNGFAVTMKQNVLKQVLEYDEVEYIGENIYVEFDPVG